LTVFPVADRILQETQTKTKTLKAKTMKTTTETLSTDPWKFAATATCNGKEYTYVGDEGESRGVCKTAAKKALESILKKQ
jgi:hypothetical protein